MDKSEMLKYCKYYHGKDKNPYDDNDITFGIIVFIEMLFSKHDPYNTMDWIYNY